MSDSTITLGTRELPVAALPLGRLKKLVPAFNRAGRAFMAGDVEEAALDDVFTVLSQATGLSVDELEAMPGTYSQLMAAIEVVADVCGLKPKEPPPGEALPGMSPSPASTPGTPSTPA